MTATTSAKKGGFFRPDATADGWQNVKTFSATLDEQQVPEQLTLMWYRTTVQVPKDLPPGPVHLWFGEVDGSPTRVWINGEFAGEFGGSRRPGEIEITGKLVAGKDNFVAVRTGTSASPNSSWAASSGP